MLLGRDDVILNVCPTYETDALVRRVNIDRYDDREIVRTNLIESYDKLMEFAKKNLPDKFFLEDTDRVSLRNVLAREMLSNTLMHREFSSSYEAKFVIEQDKMYVENANRATKLGEITPDNLEPNPKNPLIASFFRNIGRADRLGSGVRNLFKYSKFYSGQEPKFIEEDVFKIIVPLDDKYSYDFRGNSNKMPISADKVPISADDKYNEQQKIVLLYVIEQGRITTKEVESILSVKERRARAILSELVKMGALIKKGSYKSTFYVFGE